MSNHSIARLAGAALLLLAPTGFAAAPASGTLSAGNPSLTYASGPFAVSNASLAQTPDAPVCDPADPCDDFALTVSLPADYATTHPRDVVTVTALWSVNNQDAYFLYLLDGAGHVVDSQQSANDPNTLTFPARPGTYTVRIVPQTAGGDLLSTTVVLHADQTGAPPPGIGPRFQVQVPPAGLGDNLNGEMNIGYNPVTHRVLTLGFIQVLRTTFADDLDPPLPAACDAQWADVSDPVSQQNTNDPILATDPRTGRTFVSQLQGGTPGESIFVYTDDDGASWTQAPLTVDGGVDHQTVGGGPYPQGLAGPTTAYPDAVYYCSQSAVAAFCIRSDDGGATFGAPSTIKTAADCGGFLGGIHGHVKVAPNGSVYVPDRQCAGAQTLIRSDNAGATWSRHPIPNSTVGDSDPSLGIATDGTLYYCYLNGDGHVHATVSHDGGDNWVNDRDIAYAQGVIRAVFPEAVAGDPTRAACAFLGTTTPGNYQATDFDGIWYAYVATTYDGGDTWHTVNATPNDPVQGVGGICTAGTTCISNRNLLDFNEITRDERGRVLFGFDDGCTGDCVTTHIPEQACIPTFVGDDVCLNAVAKTTIVRQSGGRTLLGQFDPVGPEPAAPAPACLAGGRSGGAARLVWKTPDNGGAGITGFRVYRGTAPGSESLIGQVGWTGSFDDNAADPAVGTYFYKVTAINARGESVASNTVSLAAGGTLPAVPGPLALPPNHAPLASLNVYPGVGSGSTFVTFDATATYDPDNGDVLRYAFDFGDRTHQTIGRPQTHHTYFQPGDYPVTLTVTDSRGGTAIASGTAHVVAPAFGALDDAYIVKSDSHDVALPVMGNDASASAIHLVRVSTPGQGGSAVIAGNVISYSPAPGYTGPEGFRYVISNGTTTSAAHVRITVRANREPIARADSFTVAASSGPQTLRVRSNDGDPDRVATPADTLHVISVSTPDHGGSASLSSTGLQVVYQPAAGFTGTETFMYTIADDSGAVASAQVTVTVQ